MLINILKAISRVFLLNSIFSHFASRSERLLVIFTYLNNFFPVAAALLLGWNVGDILVFFWVDNVVIGIFHAFKMILGQAEAKHTVLQKIGAAVSFLFIWGIFTLVHGVFVFIFTILIYALGQPLSEGQFYATDYNLKPLIIAFAASGIIHLLDFIFNFLMKKEYLKVDPSKVFMHPFGKVMVLHIALIAFGWIFFGVTFLLYALITGLQEISADASDLMSKIGFLILSIIAALLLGAVKTWWDLRVIFHSDKLGEYTSDEQKQQSLYRRAMREKVLDN